ncbi:hypothetical protein B0J12DRAFT_87350 [Macrophomina phaseolina]|uniref:Uncharacterized protein n=1 Tax=Macrophomina phaseolina TaxID=35725 RepID=A0ABQ8GAG8_9PEZI|nr:hypothetical protein B0J12DRAFT_87350 [Macrophomina phaseolina]
MVARSFFFLALFAPFLLLLYLLSQIKEKTGMLFFLLFMARAWSFSLVFLGLLAGKFFFFFFRFDVCFVCVCVCGLFTHDIFFLRPLFLSRFLRSSWT